MGIIPARKAVAFQVKQGQDVTVINTHGKQVVDFWAFNPRDPHDYLSMVHTRTVLLKVALSEGDRLYSTRRKPLLTLVKDTTTQGVHDILWSACDAERYRMQGLMDIMIIALTTCTRQVHPRDCTPPILIVLLETGSEGQLPWFPYCTRLGS